MPFAKALSNLDRRGFAAEHIDHGQHPERLSIAELIMHKVQAPRLVRPSRLATRLPMHKHLGPASNSRLTDRPFHDRPATDPGESMG